MATSEIYYDPYRPPGFGDGMTGAMLQMMAGAMTSQFGFQIQAPTGYSNSAQLWSKLQNDRYHQEAMRMASIPSSERVSNVLQSMLAPAMYAGGKQYTSEQQESLRRFTQMVMPYAAGIGMQSQFGRSLVDMAAGGYAQENLASAYALNRKTMVDPVTGGSLSLAGINAQSQALFNDIYGGTAAERRAKSSGFLPGEMHNMLTYLARQGRLGGDGSMRAMAENPYLARAARDGTFTQEDLDNLGVGEFNQIAGKDLSDPKVQEAIYKVNASKQRGEMQQLAKLSAAVKDILVDSKLPAEIENIMESLGTFTERYSTQLSSSRISALMRQSHAALKDFGYGFNEMVALQDVARQTATQFGYEEGFTPVLARNQSMFMGTLLGNQRFAVDSYGLGNAMQQGQMRGQIEAGFGKSVKGSALAAIALLAQNNKIDTSTDAGKRVAAILQDMKGSNYIGDQEFVSMSPEQQAQLIAKGLGVSTSRVFETMSNQFPLEAITHEMNLTRFAGQFAMDDLSDDIRNAAISSVMGEFEGVDPDQARRFAELIGDAAVVNVRDNALITDRKNLSKTSGAMTYQDIKAKADAGNQDAKALLARAGNTEAEQRAYLEKLANYGVQGIEGAFNTNVANLNMQFGSRTEADLGQFMVTKNMEALKSEMLSQTSLAGMRDLFTSISSRLEETGGTATEGGATISDVMGALKDAVGGKLTEENEQTVIAAMQELNQLKEEQQKAADAYAKDPRNQAAAAAAKQYSEAIDGVIQEIMDNTGLRLAEPGEAVGVRYDENGNPVATAVPKEVAEIMEAKFTGGVTIQLGEDAVIQIKDAMIRADRGTSDTVGNQ